MSTKKGIAVVYIITKLELGGAQKICLSLFKGAEQHRITSYLISGSHGKLVSSVEQEPNTILLPELQREVSWFGFWYECVAFFKLVRTLRSIRHQHLKVIVHTHSTKAGLMGRWAALCAGIATRVHTIHGYGFHAHQRRSAWLITFLLEWVTSLITTHFICVSTNDKVLGSRLFPGFAHKSSLIRAAVDTEIFFTPAHKTNWPKQKELFIFGTVACFKPQKNLFDLLMAFELVHSVLPRTRLEIIGDGALRPKLESWIMEHHLQDAVVLHGWKDSVAEYLHTWHAFVMSSLWEGLPCAIVEARLQKLPVISYDTGGISDVIIHGTNGLLCPQKDWQALAQNMLALVQQPHLYTKLHEHADQLDEFNMATMIKHHVKLYRHLLK